jgi:cobalamin biosynthesis protein CobD/CbiB
MTLVPCYTYYAWAKKNNIKIGYKTPMIHILVGIGLIIVIIITQFLNYMIGIMYLINIIMGLVISILILMIAISGNSVIE